MEDLVGKFLGKYKILEEIGRGGMGVVYKAQDTVLSRLVAIKVLAPHLAWEEAFVERFLNEARLSARLAHPAIVRVYDVGNDGGWYYIVMEYLQGVTLSSRIEGKEPLPVPEALSVLEQLAGALDYAHGQGLVHRDVKPANIIIAPGGKVTLTDFGIAKAFSGTRLTATGVAVGTPCYMAPEQVTGEELGPWTDLYSLGVVAYEMLAGRAPFGGETAAVLHKVAYEAVPPITTFRADLPGEVQNVLNMALAKGRAGRFPSAAAFVAALSAALAGKRQETTLVKGQEVWEAPAPQPSTGSVVAPLEVAPPAARRRRLPGWAWVVLGVAVVAAVTLLALQRIPQIAPWLAFAPLPPTIIPTPQALATPVPTMLVTSLPEVRARVVVSRARLRSGPGGEYALVEELVAGDEVWVTARVTSASGEVWLLVRRPEEGLAWVSANAVELQGDLTGVPTAVTVPPTMAAGTLTATTTPGLSVSPTVLPTEHTATPGVTDTPRRRSSTPRPPENHAPEIRSLTASATIIWVGEEALFACDAYDPDGDSLSYQWFVDGQVQEAGGPQFTYRGTRIGQRVIRVVVRDGRGGEAAREATIEVTPGEPTATAPSPTKPSPYPKPGGTP